MKTSESKTKVAAIVVTCLFFASLTGLVVMHDSNTSLDELLNGSKLKNESLLSEKLTVEKEISELKKQIAMQLGKNKEIDQLLAQANSNLYKKEQEIRRNAGNNTSKKDLADLRQIKSSLEKDVAFLNGKINNLETEKDNLNSQLALAQAQNKELNSTVSLMEALAINNYRIDATKKNDQLTVVARKTKNLKMAFDLPQHIASNINFKVRTPDGKIIDKSDAALAYGIVENGGDLSASIQPLPVDMKVSKRIEMSYQPKEKLKKGVYTIDIMNGDTYISSCQVKLR